MRRIAVSLLFFLTMPALACEPTPGFKAPTLQENYKNARTVVFGYITKKEPAEQGYAFQVRVEKAWKGTLLKEIRVTAGLSSTCDGFAQSAEVGAGCLLFLGPNDKVFSGMEFGNVSICVPAGSPRLKTIVGEYDTRFGRHDPKSECEAKGGRWEGEQMGKGRLSGCNMPTTDGGKACKSGEDCQSVCLRDGKCHAWSQFKGCASYHGHKGLMCVD